MRLSFARSDDPNDGRVAVTPETVSVLIRHGVDVEVETRAGEKAGHSDDAYIESGAAIVPGEDLFARAEVAVSVVPPSVDRLATMAEGSLLIGLLRPVHAVDAARVLVERKVTALAMELVPRTSRFQPMDALSSQAGVAGYKAVLMAADRIDKMFPLAMTAAGTIRPAEVVVLGVGVAGLQAIATARRLGAAVKANDVRAAAAGEVRSLGADFVHIPGVTDQEGGAYAKALGADLARAQHEALAPHVARADAVVCTAQIPGRRAPVLLTEEMVDAMPPGSVVIDLAAEDGGNCALTDPGGEVTEHSGTRVVPVPQAARLLPREASALYARNIAHLVEHLVGEDGAPSLDHDEELRSMVLVRDGEAVHGPTARALDDDSHVGTVR
ncbi:MULTISPECIES: NAD(P)(+) transhydrogenase (Re/Si-specific) subunit alpha [unclassified Nocardiopsis]|uniref:NAD(P)(+) transhydrogenase (Re/Si-specific) subunit alpha n=1 Tax=Nocardiopsis TaxID=2013 RepID=UPI00387A8BB0